MTGEEITALIRRHTKTNSTTYTDANLLVDINLMKDEIASKIQQVRSEIWNMPALDDLVLAQREYAFPDDVLNHIISLELKFSATGDYVIADPLGRKHYPDALQESKIIGDFDNEEPRYFSRRKAIYILSGAIIAVTDGVKLVYDAFPANLANLTGTDDLSKDPSTTTHGFPREFHELWARRVSIEYKDINNIKLSKKENDYERDLYSALDDFQVANLDENIIGGMPSSSDEGNDGEDY